MIFKGTPWNHKVLQSGTHYFSEVTTITCWSQKSPCKSGSWFKKTGPKYQPCTHCSRITWSMQNWRATVETHNMISLVHFPVLVNSHSTTFAFDVNIGHMAHMGDISTTMSWKPCQNCNFLTHFELSKKTLCILFAVKLKNDWGFKLIKSRSWSYVGSLPADISVKWSPLDRNPSQWHLALPKTTQNRLAYIKPSHQCAC